MLPDLTRNERKQVSKYYIEIATDHGWSNSQMKAEIEAFRYENCGNRYCVYQCDTCRLNYRTPASCNSRICEKCGSRMRRSVEKRFIDLVRPLTSKKMKTYSIKFLTLTFDTKRWAGRYPSQSDFKRCQREVKELVVRYFHKYKAKKSKNGGYYLTTKFRGAGAIGVPELGQGTNIHFHLLVYAPYIPQKTLSDAWFEITGDSMVVDIKQVHNPKKAVSYILKYITKPPQTKTYEDIANWAWLIKGSRRLKTYGIFYNKLPIKKKRDDKQKLLCVFDAGRLRFRGESADRSNELIDWLQYLKYIDNKASPNLRTYMEMTPYGLKNKNFNLN